MVGGGVILAGDFSALQNFGRNFIGVGRAHFNHGRILLGLHFELKIFTLSGRKILVASLVVRDDWDLLTLGVRNHWRLVGKCVFAS